MLVSVMTYLSCEVVRGFVSAPVKSDADDLVRSDRLTGGIAPGGCDVDLRPRHVERGDLPAGYGHDLDRYGNEPLPEAEEAAIRDDELDLAAFVANDTLHATKRAVVVVEHRQTDQVAD